MEFNLISDNINYLKINYKDKNNFAHYIKAAIRLINDFEIVASAKLEGEINIETPQIAEISFVCENGLYRAQTELKRIEKEEPYTLFLFKKPQELSYHQKREFFRVKIKESASVIFENESEEIINLPVLTYDISASGVRVELDSNVKFSENVKIVLFLPKKNVEIKAKYIRTDNDDGVIKASFKFEHIADADLDYISQICIQKQLEERRKNLL